MNALFISGGCFSLPPPPRTLELFHLIHIASYQICPCGTCHFKEPDITKKEKKKSQSIAFASTAEQLGDLFWRVGVDFYSNTKSHFKPPVTPFSHPSMNVEKKYITSGSDSV